VNPAMSSRFFLHSQKANETMPDAGSLLAIEK